MVEYIERNALIAEFKRLTLGENSLVERLFADGVYAVIETFPAADVVEVRHGHWEFLFLQTVMTDLTPRVKCSECGGIEAAFARWKYCPNCGALMKEDKHEAG